MIARWAIGSLFIVVLAAGCGSNTATVEGKVYLQDTIVQAGRVVFQQGSVMQSAEIQPDGKYIVAGVPVGEVKIGVIGPPKGPATDAKTAAMMKAQKGKIAGDKTVEEVAVKKLAIPIQYNDPEKSGVSTSVKAGKNEYDIKLPK